MAPTKLGSGTLDQFRDEKTYHHKVFEELLHDAVLLAYMAHDQRKADDLSSLPSTLTRAAVISSCLLLECAANCCIDAMDKTGPFKDDIDKLPFLTKFEVFLDSLKGSTKFDRGSLRIQKIGELKTIRDSYVHPKVKKHDWIFESEAQKRVHLGYTKLLELPFDIRLWDPPHCVTALRAVNDFLAHYFGDLCAFDANTTCDVLLSDTKVIFPSRVNYAIDMVGELDRATNEWGLSFKWLGKQ